MHENESEDASLMVGENDVTAQLDGENLLYLRNTRDAAVRAAQDAVRDTTRLTRLLTILSEPAPLNILLDRVLATLSELFSADIIILLDPASTGTFSPLAAIGLPEDMLQQELLHNKGSYTASAMKSRTSILAEVVSNNTDVDPQLLELGVQSAVWLPVTGSYALVVY